MTPQPRLSQTGTSNFESRRSSSAIDLLVIGEDASDASGRPSLSRGLSIRLTPPEDQDEDGTSPRREVPTFYKSNSVVSVASFGSSASASSFMRGPEAEIRIPRPERRLSDLIDPVREALGAPLPLHRTESRLPSLERILKDPKLCTTLFYDAESEMLKEIAEVLRSPDDKDKFRGLQELCRRSGSNDDHFNINRVTEKQRTAIIETVVLFVKQQLTRVVDYWRTMIDQQELGMSAEDFESSISDAPFDYSIKPWSFISLGLKLLRNFCDSAEVQDVLFQHNLADALVLRHRLLFAAVSKASAIAEPAPQLKPYYDEVATVLPRSLFTFISNLITNNDKLRCHFWTPMWPIVYWTYLVMSGDRFFDPFCLLLHNHLTPLIADNMESEDDVEVERQPSRAVRDLEADLRLLASTEEELAVKLANTPRDGPNKPRTELKSDFLKFLMAILAVTHMKNERFARGGQFRRSRLASVEGRAAEASAVDTEWFGLLLLRLISLGKGHALKLLLTSILAKSKDPIPTPKIKATPGVSADVEELAVKAAAAGVPSEVLYFVKSAPECERYLPEKRPTPVQLAGLLIYTAARNASVSDEVANIQLQETEEANRQGNEVIKQRAAEKLGRKYNLVRRGFITPGVTLFMADLLKESLSDLASEIRKAVPKEGVFERVLTLLREDGFDEAKRRGADMARLTRPLTRCLRHLAAAPELKGRWNESVAQVCWRLACAILKDVAPFFQEFVASGAVKRVDDSVPDPSIPLDGYTMVLQSVSPRDVLLLLSTLADMTPDLRDDCDKDLFAAIVGFTTFQTDDENCEQASVLALKVLTQEHEGNVELVRQVVPSVKSNKFSEE